MLTEISLNVTAGPFKKTHELMYVDRRCGVTGQLTLLTYFQYDEYDIQIFRPGLHILYQK